MLIAVSDKAENALRHCLSAQTKGCIIGSLCSLQLSDDLSQVNALNLILLFLKIDAIIGVLADVEINIVLLNAPALSSEHRKACR